MINIDVKIDTSRFDRKMADVPTRFAAAQKRTLEAIGTEVSSRATRAFRSETLRPSCLHKLDYTASWRLIRQRAPCQAAEELVSPA